MECGLCVFLMGAIECPSSWLPRVFLVAEVSRSVVSLLGILIVTWTHVLLESAMETWYAHDVASVRMTSLLGVASWEVERVNATFLFLCVFASPRCHGSVRGHVEPENSLGQTMHPNLKSHLRLVVLQVSSKKWKL